MQVSLNTMDDITLLNRLTLNSDGSADEEVLYRVLEDGNCLFIFRKLIKKITKITANQIEKLDSKSDKIVFKIKFDDNSSAKEAKELISDNEYKIAKNMYKVKVEQNNNKLKLVIKSDK